MKKSDFKKLIKEEIIKILKEELNLNNLKIGQSVKIELLWHRDDEDRTVEILGETDWKVAT
jgi:hypothetical protein